MTIEVFFVLRLWGCARECTASNFCCVRATKCLSSASDLFARTPMSADLQLAKACMILLVGALVELVVRDEVGGAAEPS